MKKIFTLAMLACLSMGAWAAADDLPQTSTQDSPRYYMIRNTRANYYANFAGASAQMTLSNTVTSTTESALFWFEAVDVADLPAGVMAVKIHEKGSNLSCASTSSFTSDGIVWYLKANVYNGTPSVAINSSATVWNNNGYGWNNVSGNNQKIGAWSSTDIGSAWAFEDATPATASEISDAKSIIGTGIGYPKTSNAAYTALNALQDGATVGQVTKAKENYISCTDINLPEEGKAYQFSMVKTDGTATWGLVANGNSLSLSADGTPTTFYCHKINNGNPRYVFITEEGKLLAFRELTDNYDRLYVGSNLLTNDFAIQPLVGQSSGFITSTKEQRLGYVSLTSDNRVSGNGAGCYVVNNNDGSFNAGTAPFHRDDVSSAVKITEVSGNINDSNPASFAKAKIDALVDGYLHREYYGEGIGKYNIDEFGTKLTWAEYNARIGAAVDQDGFVGLHIRLNEPAAGFYRFKGHINNRYITSSDGGNTLGLPASRANDATEIFYVAKNASKFEILNYSNGLYWSNNQSVNVGGDKGQFTFQQAINNSNEPLLCQYWIQTNNSYNDILQPWNNGLPQISNEHKNIDNQSGWDIEPVTSLPIKVNEVEGAYYGTINLPVAVTIPAGLKAYSAVADGSVLTLTKVVENGVLAANTPVILYSGEDVTSLAIADEVGAGATGNELLGTVAAATVVANENYVLSNQTSGIGFYKYNNTTMPGFKAYLPATAKTNANKLAFNFEDVLTAIQAIESNNCSAEIFDLQGRRLNQAQKGMNIINGHKVLVK